MSESGEIMPGREPQPSALGSGNAFGRGAERPIAPQPYFDEDQHFAVAGNEIDFAAAAAIIALNDREPARRKIACRERFGRGAAIHCADS